MCCLKLLDLLEELAVELFEVDVMVIPHLQAVAAATAMVITIQYDGHGCAVCNKFHEGATRLYVRTVHFKQLKQLSWHAGGLPVLGQEEGHSVSNNSWGHLRCV